ncbi:MAG: response regulator [Magnetococcales bacterium]|nr:response regulator [Magnetococcales bacterium]
MQPIKILIVDDHLHGRQLLHAILRPFGHCDLAENGMDAVVLVEDALRHNAHYDLILLDIMMPEMNGQAALHAIRAAERDLGMAGNKEAVIFMVTGVSSTPAVIEAFFKGYCTDYLTKPITRQILLDKLQEYRLIAPDMES